MTDYKLMPKQITEEMADAFWEEYSKDRHDDLLMRCYKALYVTAPAPQPVEQQSAPNEQTVVGWQFYQDGKWWNGDDRIKDHRKNTEAAGYLVRDVYAAQQPAEQGEPVGYVRPHHLEMLRSGKVCGITMEDKPDAHNRVTMPLYTAQQEGVPEETINAVTSLVKDAASTRLNSEFNSCLSKIRELLYTAPQPAEQQPISHDWDDQDKCLAILNLSEAARSLGVAQAKDDQDAIGYWRTEVIRFEREARQPTPDVAVMVMVRALERIANMGSMSHHSLESAKITARNALDVLAAHHNQGDEL